LMLMCASLPSPLLGLHPLLQILQTARALPAFADITNMEHIRALVAFARLNRSGETEKES
jgi:hypothetical protein